ncbi:hypothetical protein AYY19_08350 [Photobacterium aquimaris]|uniref:DUF3332 domain-containing protein n=1 Tax=Photobacterium aquimaris TaxID=512643 RepID=UPI0007F01625|nr:DUF3332 domain-containing protein [Photobacterium aquimaris]OBU12913.1 hypothetical protein AYY19_08350 [Photobacterium aquimaris]PSW00700.1 DUF3332 domain-containing protein [Photobacterium aquimaris]
MKKFALKAVAIALLTTSLTGCIGQMGVSKVVTKANLSAVDNRYGRAGLYVLLSPVYGIAATADLFIFNSIEFWTGKNPITGKSPAVADMKLNTYLKINNMLDRSLTTVPLARVQNSDIKAAAFKQLDDNTLEMKVSHHNGTTTLLRGEKAGDAVNFYLDGEFITAVTVADLDQYADLQA